jgi:hypothetical protein
MALRWRPAEICGPLLVLNAHASGIGYKERVTFQNDRHDFRYRSSPSRFWMHAHRLRNTLFGELQQPPSRGILVGISIGEVSTQQVTKLQ